MEEYREERISREMEWDQKGRERSKKREKMEPERGKGTGDRQKGKRRMARYRTKGREEEI